MTDDTPELAALTELVQSEGWKVFTARVDAQFGPAATLAALRRTVGAVPLGDQAAVQDAAQHVLTAQGHVLALLAWPAQRIQELSHTPKPSQWAHLRRTAR